LNQKAAVLESTSLTFDILILHTFLALIPAKLDYTLSKHFNKSKLIFFELYITLLKIHVTNLIFLIDLDSKIYFDAIDMTFYLKKLLKCVLHLILFYVLRALRLKN